MIRGEARIWGLKKGLSGIKWKIVEAERMLPGRLYSPFLRLSPREFIQMLAKDKRFRYDIDSQGYLNIFTRGVIISKKIEIEGRHPFTVFVEEHKNLFQYLEVKRKRRIRFHIPSGHLGGLFLVRIGVVPYVGILNARTYIGYNIIDLFPLINLIVSFFGNDITVSVAETFDPRFFTKMPVVSLEGVSAIGGFVFPNIDLQKHGVFSWIDTWFYSRPGYENGVAKLFIYEGDGHRTESIQTFVAPPFLKREAHLKIEGLGEWTVFMKPGYRLETETHTDSFAPGGPIYYF